MFLYKINVPQITIGARLSCFHCVRALYSIEFKDINCKMSPCQVISEQNGVAMNECAISCGLLKCAQLFPSSMEDGF